MGKGATLGGVLSPALTWSDMDPESKFEALPKNGRLRKGGFSG